MSYILEALRRADAERERGAVPNLHAQAAPAADPGDDEGRANTKPWLWVGLGVTVTALAGVGLWAFSGRHTPPGAELPPMAAAPSPGAMQPGMLEGTTGATPAARSEPSTAAGGIGGGGTNPAPTPPPAPHSPTLDLPAPRPDQAPPPPAPRPAPPPAPSPSATLGPTAAPAAGGRAAPTTSPPAVTAAPPMAAPAPAPAQAPVPSWMPPPTPAAPPQAAPQAPPMAAATPPAAQPPAAPAPRVLTMAELPDDLRRQLPQLSIGGAMYSDNPGARMLIVNGRALREGDKAADGLVLEQIKLKAAVLNFRGTRYEITY